MDIAELKCRCQRSISKNIWVLSIKGAGRSTTGGSQEKSRDIIILFFDNTYHGCPRNCDLIGALICSAAFEAATQFSSFVSAGLKKISYLFIYHIEQILDFCCNTPNSEIA